MPFFSRWRQNESFIFYSNFTEAHLLVPAGFLLESIAAPGFEERFVYRKYSTKSESRASLLVRCVLCPLFS